MQAEIFKPGRSAIRPLALALALAAGASVAGCGGKGDGPAKGPPEVGFRVIHPTSAPIELELPGRIAAAQIAEVRPQIAGIIERRLFTEGSLVHAGQPLYRIDSRLYRA
ncbi:MAG TPA: biotin/lipoyl-binding protein, partial [Novosphingobium sp.]